MWPGQLCGGRRAHYFMTSGTVRADDRRNASTINYILYVNILHQNADLMMKLRSERIKVAGATV